MEGTRKIRKTKTGVCLEYMKTHEYITDEKGHELCNTNRMGSIIFELRKKHHIRTEMVDDVDIYGHHVRYGRYYYLGEIAEKEA